MSFGMAAIGVISGWAASAAAAASAHSREFPEATCDTNSEMQHLVNGTASSSVAESALDEGDARLTMCRELCVRS